VLFRKYPELGGRLLAFNNTLDGLIFANLPQPTRRLLEFYMGRDCAAQYLSTIWRWTGFAAARQCRRMDREKGVPPEKRASFHPETPSPLAGEGRGEEE
jgi:hypothetical protein